MGKRYTSRSLISGTGIEYSGSLVADDSIESEIYLFILDFHLKDGYLPLTGLEAELTLPPCYKTVPPQSTRITLPELSVSTPNMHMVWRLKKDAAKSSTDYFKLILRLTGSGQVEEVLFRI